MCPSFIMFVKETPHLQGNLLSIIRFGHHAESLRITVETGKLIVEAPANLARETIRELIDARACQIEEAPNLNQAAALKLTIEASPQIIESTLHLLMGSKKYKI